ncbi:MAG: type II toxin-antitoxin system death-on-curing family toxin [Planctomycetota bacterium]|nr:type II toxin-antitoxin system death-on-curing family toxin [Planctomycetota bacterium]
MTRDPAFLSTDQVLAIHYRMIEEFGGEPTVRDVGLLESAVAMPAAGMGGRFLHKGIPAMAAAYLFHLCRNHPFVDGNKRTALVAAEVFLLSNDCRLAATNAQLEQLTLGVAACEISKAETVAFFRRHAMPAKKSP